MPLNFQIKIKNYNIYIYIILYIKLTIKFLPHLPKESSSTPDTKYYSQLWTEKYSEDPTNLLQFIKFAIYVHFRFISNQNFILNPVSKKKKEFIFNHTFCSIKIRIQIKDLPLLFFLFGRGPLFFRHWLNILEAHNWDYSRIGIQSVAKMGSRVSATATPHKCSSSRLESTFVIPELILTSRINFINFL